jgi:hypothetical protein
MGARTGLLGRLGENPAVPKILGKVSSTQRWETTEGQ